MKLPALSVKEERIMRVMWEHVEHGVYVTERDIFIGLYPGVMHYDTRSGSMKCMTDCLDSLSSKGYVTVHPTDTRDEGRIILGEGRTFIPILTREDFVHNVIYGHFEEPSFFESGLAALQRCWQKWFKRDK